MGNLKSSKSKGAATAAPKTAPKAATKTPLKASKGAK